LEPKDARWLQTAIIAKLRDQVRSMSGHASEDMTDHYSRVDAE
jgi:hypothetical protein